MNKMSFEAREKNLPQVIAYIGEKLKEAGFPARKLMQIQVAVEEIYVNVCHYAYGSDVGDVEIDIEFQDDPPLAEISFSDWGMPFNPLKKLDPDIHLGLEERPVGGLGIFMIKKLMDDVRYKYEDGKNHLTIIKRF